MPIYEFLCDQCRERFSLLLKMSSGEEGVACPKCGGPAKRQISSCAIGSTTDAPSCNVGGGGG